jgi:hypothetical protein
LQHRQALSGLAAFARRTRFALGRLGDLALTRFGRLLAVVAFLPGLRSTGAALAPLGPVVAVSAAVAFSAMAPPFRRWRAFQIRATALSRFSNFFTGFSSAPNPVIPANEFQTVTNRSMGQFAVSAPNASWLAKDYPLAAASASGGLANAVMLLSVSTVNIVMALSPWCRARRS